MGRWSGGLVSSVRIECPHDGCDWHVQAVVSSVLVGTWIDDTIAQHEADAHGGGS
jgi:hypothetical protein